MMVYIKQTTPDILVQLSDSKARLMIQGETNESTRLGFQNMLQQIQDGSKFVSIEDKFGKVFSFNTNFIVFLEMRLLNGEENEQN